MKLLVDLLLFMLNAACGYSLVIFCEYRMLCKLRSMDQSSYASTRRMQADISRALVALAVSPLLSAVIPGKTGLHKKFRDLKVLVLGFEILKSFLTEFLS